MTILKKLTGLMIGAATFAVLMAGSAVTVRAADDGAGVSTSDSAQVVESTPTPAAPLAPAAAAPADDKWRFNVTPLAIWAFGVEGPIRIGGITRDVNVSFSDIDNKIDGGGGFGFEFGKGKFGGFLNAMDIKFLESGVPVGDPAAGSTAIADVRLEIQAVEGGFVYSVGEPGPKSAKMKIKGGLRYNKWKGRVNAASATASGFDRDRSQDWTDPYIGLNLALPVAGKCVFVTSLDAGGFGISADHTSQFTWNLMTGFGYGWRFSSWGMSLFGGYKAEEIDYRNSDPNKLQVIQRMDGPVVSLSFNF